MPKLLPAALIGLLSIPAVPGLVMAQQVAPAGGAVVVLSSQWSVNSQELNDEWCYQTSATGSLKNNTRGTITTVLLSYQDINPRTNQVYGRGTFVATVNPLAPGATVNFATLIRTDAPTGSLQITQVQWLNQDQTMGMYTPTWQNNNYLVGMIGLAPQNP